MSAEYQGKNPLDLAKEAERNMNDWRLRADNRTDVSDSKEESGVNANVRGPGASVTYGSAASGAGDNREIPLSEGGDLDPLTGKPYKARDYEGVGGPEDKRRLYAQQHGGEQDADAAAAGAK